MVPVAVGREAADLGAGLAGCDDIEDRRAGDAAEHLGDHVLDDLTPGEASPGSEPDRYGGIEVAARHAAHGIDHGEDGEAEGERDADEADPELRKGCGQDRAAASAQHQPGGSQKFGIETIGNGHLQ